MENKKYELDKLIIAMLQLILDKGDIDEKTFNISIQKIQNQESRAWESPNIRPIEKVEHKWKLNLVKTICVLLLKAVASSLSGWKSKWNILVNTNFW